MEWGSGCMIGLDVCRGIDVGVGKGVGFVFVRKDGYEICNSLLGAGGGI